MQQARVARQRPSLVRWCSITTTEVRGEVVVTRSMNKVAIITLVFLSGACTRLANIQEQQPVRTLNFTGSYKTMAQCVQHRIGGQVREEGFGSTFVIFDSVKRTQAEDGITHYSITITQSGANVGTAAWRVVLDRTTGQQGTTGKPFAGQQAPGTDGFPEQTVAKYWKPVENCAAQVASAKP